MIDTSTIVKLTLKKKNWTNMDLVRKINELEDSVGDKEKTVRQNLTNYLNGYHDWGYKFTRKVEVALGLPNKTLLNTLKQPKSAYEKEVYKEVIGKYRVVKK